MAYNLDRAFKFHQGQDFVKLQDTHADDAHAEDHGKHQPAEDRTGNLFVGFCAAVVGDNWGQGLKDAIESCKMGIQILAPMATPASSTVPA